MTYELFDNVAKAYYHASAGKPTEAREFARKALSLISSAVDQVESKEDGKTLMLYFEDCQSVLRLLHKGKCGSLSMQETLLFWGSKLTSGYFYPWKYNPMDLELTRQQEDETDKGNYTSKDGLIWQRLDASSMSLLKGSSPSSSIWQDQMNDCSVVASLISALEYESRTGRTIITNRIFPQHSGIPQLSDSGVYIARLEFNGCSRRVRIDDYLPKEPNHSKSLHVSTRDNWLLPALLEKAYLTVMGGYNFPGSHSSFDTYVLTGWIPEYLYLSRYRELTTESIWEKLYMHWRQGDVIMNLGTGMRQSGSELISNHDYSVLDLTQNGRQKIIFCNPWRESTERNCEMLFEDVLAEFDCIYLNWNPETFSYTKSIPFSWSSSAIREADFSANLFRSPQFCVTNLSEEESSILIYLSGPICSKDEYGRYLTFYIYDSSHAITCTQDMMPVYKGDGMNINYHSAYISVPGKSSRIVTPLVSEASHCETERIWAFSLSVHSKLPIEVKRARYKTEYSYEIKGSWNGDTRGGNILDDMYGSNPQYVVSVGSGSFRGRALLMADAFDEPIALHLFSNSGRRVWTYDENSLVAQSGQYKSKSSTMNISRLPQGQYTLVPSCFVRKSGNFSLIIMSNEQSSIEELPSQSAGLFETEIAREWDDSLLRATFLVKRYTSLKLRVKFVPANLKNYPTMRLTLRNGCEVIASSGSHVKDGKKGLYLDNITLETPSEYSIALEKDEPVAGQVKIAMYTSEAILLLNN